MTTRRWMRRLEKWRGIERVEENLAPYEEALREINRLGEDFARKTDDQLREIAALLRERMRDRARGACLRTNTRRGLRASAGSGRSRAGHAAFRRPGDRRRSAE